jgi:hypothetical protein
MVLAQEIKHVLGLGRLGEGGVAAQIAEHDDDLATMLSRIFSSLVRKASAAQADVFSSSARCWGLVTHGSKARRRATELTWGLSLSEAASSAFASSRSPLRPSALPSPDLPRGTLPGHRPEAHRETNQRHRQGKRETWG